MTDRSSASAAPGVVIGIPTFRRPERLERLLSSLEPSLRAHGGTRLIVADNACEETTQALVARFAERWPATRYLAVPERGISANRNALVAGFLADPDARWLGMLDDDLAVGPEWLTNMLAVGERGAIDVVGGPYSYTGPAGFVAEQSFRLHRQRRPSGPCPAFHAAGNILLARSLFEAMPDLRFDDRFGLSGGEDYDFFSRAADRGARFAWADEAFGDEQVDAERLRPRAIAYRYFTSGAYMATADERRLGRRAVLASRARLLLRSAASLAAGIVSANRVRMLRGTLYLLFASGGLLSVAGYRSARYR